MTAPPQKLDRPEEQQARGLRAIPRSIWALGFVSMFMDISSEMIHALLPVFLVVVLGTSATTVGLIEGIAEATASITKIFSGTLSDWLGKRKLLAVIGYGVAALTKPLFPLATSAELVFAARFIDRIGKGIRGAPRDALVGDIAPLHVRGASYGLRQSMDTIGAFAGPLLASLLMALTADSYRTVFWLAVIPAFIAVAVLVFGVEEPEKKAEAKEAQPPIDLADWRRLPPGYWWVVLVASVFTLARFSEAFLVLRATSVGLSVAYVPLIFVAMNVVYALSAYPAGVLSDRMSRWGMLGFGFVLLAAADLVLAITSSIAGVILGVALWGLHMGFTQGIFSALVADTAPTDRRGTAFGIYNLVTGLAMLLASLAAGILWDVYGPGATFLAGLAITITAIAGTMLLYRMGVLRKGMTT